MDRVTISGEEAIKCTAWTSLPLMSVLDRQTDRRYMAPWGAAFQGDMNSKNKATGQNRKTHIWTELLLERKKRKEAKGVKRYTVLT